MRLNMTKSSDENYEDFKIKVLAKYPEIEF